jgi:carboxymethylenebutenolidase
MIAMNAEERSLDNVNPRSRRRVFLKTKLAAGFAMAVRPICAQTQIKTDTTGLTAGEVKVPSGGVAIPAYRAMPATGSNFPVVLVVQEIFGVHEHIKDICRRLGKLGYMAIAPEMYVRQGDVSKLTDFQEILQIVGKVPDAQVMADLDAAVAYTASTRKADVARLSVTGFCWGGRVVWLYAAHNAKLKAGVAWYGRLLGATGAMTPKHPLDIAKDLKAPVLGLYGAKDRGIPLDSVEKMREALRAAGNTNSRIDVYPEADHGFHADYRPTYHASSAKDGWQKLQAWFEQNGAK